MSCKTPERLLACGVERCRRSAAAAACAKLFAARAYKNTMFDSASNIFAHRQCDGALLHVCERASAHGRVNTMRSSSSSSAAVAAAASATLQTLRVCSLMSWLVRQPTTRTVAATKHHHHHRRVHAAEHRSNSANGSDTPPVGSRPLCAFSA